MANDLFNVFLANCIKVQSGFSALDLTTATIKAIFFDKDDDGTIPDYVNDQDIADMTLGRVPALGSAPTLTSPTVSATAVFDAADTTFTALTGDQVELLVVFRDAGSEATDMLIVGWDTGVTGLPLQPNGGNVTVQWNGSGILSMGA